MKIKLVFLVSFSLIIFACNKEKLYSKRFMRGDYWEVKDLSIDGVSQDLSGEWYINNDHSIYEAVPTGIWSMIRKDTFVLTKIQAKFEWQFQDKGKHFQLNYIQLCEECEVQEMDTIDYILYNISGKYDVQKHTRNKMKFESSATIGFYNKSVEIELERKK